MSIDANIANIRQLLTGIPDEDMPTGEELALYWQSVAVELENLWIHASRAEKPQVVFCNYRKAGSQYLWEFWVNDLDIPKRNAYNWHGQNVSQWLCAGAICLEAGKVSRHH